MSADTLWGVLFGGLLFTVVIFAGLGLAQWLDRSKREEEIQARLTRLQRKAENMNALLEKSYNENSAISSDLQFTRQICGSTIEQTLAYFEQSPKMFGDKKRELIIAELHQTLTYTGKTRVEPIALLEHILTNGGDNESTFN